MIARETERRLADMGRRLDRVPARWARGVPLTRIRIGRGNSVFSSGGFTMYGSKNNFNPTTISAGMWNATTKAWIPADTTWDNGVCYGYLDGGAVVAVAQRFGGKSGKITNVGVLCEGALVYSATTTTYALGADTLTIYLVDEF